MLSHDEAQELHRILGGPLETSNASDILFNRAEVERARELVAIIVADTEGGRDSDPSENQPVLEFKGTITLAGTTSHFMMLDDGGWTQWGVDQRAAGQRVDLLDNVASAYQEWQDENLCSVCKENMLDDGEGYDGMCGNCADKSTCVADCSPDDEDLDGPCSECGTDWSKWDGEDHEQFRFEQRQERED
jgi:hypothetical protein